MELPTHINSLVKNLAFSGTTTRNENDALQVKDGSSGVYMDKSSEDDISDFIKADYCQILVKMIEGFSQEKTKEVIESVCSKMTKENIGEVFDGLVRLLLVHVRDIPRNGKGIGKGRRDQFYYAVLEMYKIFPLMMEKIIPPIIVKYGCWRDFRQLYNMINGNFDYYGLSQALINYHIKFIKEGDFLANKWAPREKGSNSELAKIYANLIYPERIDSYKLYRHLITRNSSHKEGCFLIETYMSSGRWDLVAEVLEKLTGGSRKKYVKAFMRHIKEEYDEYLSDVKSGKNKQNITGRTVKSIVASLTGNNTTWGAEVVLSPELCDDLNITWQKIEDNLYSKLESGEIDYYTFMALGVIDCSGSMNGGGADCAAVGLGLLMSRVTARYELNNFGKTIYGDKVLRFSSNAEVILLDCTLYPNFSDYLADFLRKEKSFRAGYNTDIIKLHQKVIEISLNIYEETGYNRSPALRIYTDMQYDDGQISGQRHDEIIDNMYLESGLVRGTTYCWNLRGDTNTSDSPYDKKNVQQIGGSSNGLITLFCEGRLLSEGDMEASTWNTCVAAIKNYSYIAGLIYKNLEVLRFSFPKSIYEKMLFEYVSERDYNNFWEKYEC